MTLCFDSLSLRPTLFYRLTGHEVSNVEEVAFIIEPLFSATTTHRQSHPNRQRASGAGPKFSLTIRDQLLLTLIWYQFYPTHQAIGQLFGISDSTVCRYIRRVEHHLVQSNQIISRQAEPSRKGRLQLSDLLQREPALGDFVDHFAVASLAQPIN